MENFRLPTTWSHYTTSASQTVVLGPCSCTWTSSECLWKTVYVFADILCIIIILKESQHWPFDTHISIFITCTCKYSTLKGTSSQLKWIHDSRTWISCTKVGWIEQASKYKGGSLTKLCNFRWGSVGRVVISSIV